MITQFKKHGAIFAPLFSLFLILILQSSIIVQASSNDTNNPYYENSHSYLLFRYSTVSYTKDSNYTVTVPYRIELNEDKKASYELTVSGNISPANYISIVPEKTSVMFQKNKINGSIVTTQDKTLFYASELANTVKTTGNVEGKNLTAGLWSGELKFTINLKDAYYDDNVTRTMWIWTLDGINDDTIVDKLISDCKKLAVTRLYQTFSVEQLESGSISSYISKMQENGIEIFYTNGSPDWGTLEKEQTVQDEIIMPIINYNKLYPEAVIKGIMLDDEFYLMDNYSDNSYNYIKEFITTSKKYYNLCHNNNLIFAQTTSINNKILDMYILDPDLDREAESFDDYITLFDTCDYVSLMVYYKNRQEDALSSYFSKFENANIPMEIISEFNDDNIYYQNYYRDIATAQQEWGLTHINHPDTQMLFSYHYYSDYLQSLIDNM